MPIEILNPERCIRGRTVRPQGRGLLQSMAEVFFRNDNYIPQNDKQVGNEEAEKRQPTT